MDNAEALAKSALFGELPTEALAALGTRASERRYRPGSVIFVQGEKGERCYVITEGVVKISAYHPDGREAVLALLGPGDVFGELSPFDQAPRSADASAVEDTTVLSFDPLALSGAVTDHPAIGVELLRVLSRRLRRANEVIQDIAFFDVGGRVARRLADLASEHGESTDDGVKIQMPLSQERLAQMVGATRESVNKALRSLQRQKLVLRRGRSYVVADIDALRARAR